MNHIDRIKKNLADVTAAAQNIDTSRTETVTVTNLNVGDVITKLGKVTFPFPITLTKVQKIGGYGYTLAASTGWFAPIVNGTDKAERVI